MSNTDKVSGLETTHSERKPTGMFRDALCYGLPDAALMKRDISVAIHESAIISTYGWKTRTMPLADFLQRLAHHANGQKEGSGFMQGGLDGVQRIKSAVTGMDIIAFDFDSGVSMNTVANTIEQQGRFGLLYTSYNDGKTEQEILVSEIAKKLRIDADDVNLEAARQYLLEHKGMLPAALENLERIVCEDTDHGFFHTPHGPVIRVRHAPVERFRLVMPLAKRFEFRSGLNIAEVQRDWSNAYRGLGEELGGNVDPSCVDVTRAFYFPRCKKGMQQNHAIWIVGGEAVDMDRVARVQPVRKAAAARDVDPVTGYSPAKEWKTPGLGKFLSDNRLGFRSCEFFAEYCENSTDLVSKMQGDCPNADEHTDSHDPAKRGGFWACDAVDSEKGEWFIAKCSHNSCSGMTGPDFVDIICERHGLTLDDLRENWVDEVLIGDLSQMSSAAAPVSAAPPINTSELEAKIDKLKNTSGPSAVRAVCAAIAEALPGDDAASELARTELADQLSRKMRGGAEDKARYRQLCTPEPIRKKQAAAAAAAKTGTERALDGVNARFALAEIGNGLAFIKKPSEPGGDVKIWDQSDFRLALRPEKITVVRNGDPQEKPIAEVWEEWSGRDYYPNGCVFEPGETVAGAFNLFTGWPVLERRPHGSWKRLKRHLFNNVCDRDKHAFRWFLVWLAEIIQRPSKKSGTALVLRGEQGVGKSLLFDQVMPQLLGRYAAVIGDRDSIGARFNSEHQGKLLVTFEEAFFVGDHGAVQSLKHMITGATRRIEPKGVDAFFVANHSRFVLISNEEQAIKADLGERRYAVFEVSTRRQRDRAYFGAIMTEMEDGGFAAMFDDLMNLDAERYLDGGFEGLRDIPETDALIEQKMMAMSVVEERLIEIIRTRRIGIYPAFPLSETEPTKVPVDRIMAHLQTGDGLTTMDKHNLKPAKVRRMVERLWGILPDDRANVMSMDGKSYRYWTVPPLPECRERLRGLGLSGFLEE